MTSSPTVPNAQTHARESAGSGHADAPKEATDIAGRDEIADLLRDFYGRAFTDALLGPVFVDIARMNLAEHLPVMCDFWQTTLFHTGTYRRNALAPHQLLHQSAHLTPQHFSRWLALWRTTVHARHRGPRADLADRQATRIAAAMSRRMTGQPLSNTDDERYASAPPDCHSAESKVCDPREPVAR